MFGIIVVGVPGLEGVKICNLSHKYCIDDILFVESPPHKQRFK